MKQGDERSRLGARPGPGWANPALRQARGLYARRGEGREQNWYHIGKVGWFTQHIREGIEVTAGQLALLQPALAQPGRLDEATVARIIRVHQDQAGDLTLLQNQADRWYAEPGLTAAQRAVVGEYEAAIGELCRLNAEVLAAAGQLKPVTVGPARQIRLGGWHRGPAPRRARDGLEQQRNGPVAVAPERPVTPSVTGCTI